MSASMSEFAANIGNLPERKNSITVPTDHISTAKSCQHLGDEISRIPTWSLGSTLEQHLRCTKPARACAICLGRRPKWNSDEGLRVMWQMKHASYPLSASPRSVLLTLTCRATLYVHAWQILNVSGLPLAFRVDGPLLVQYVDTPSPGRRRIRTSVKGGQTNDEECSASRRTSASPKSTIVPSQVVGLKRKFAGFRSRWMIPRAWISRSARNIQRKYCRTPSIDSVL